MSKHGHEHGAGDLALETGAVAHTAAEAAHAADAAHLAHAATPHVGPSQVLAPLALANGINKMVNGESALDKVEGGLEAGSGAIGTAGLVGAGLTAAGATGAGTAVTTVAAAAAPVAAVASAGAAGLAIGKFGNESVARRGWLGKEKNGEGRDWSDWWGDQVLPGNDEWSPENTANAGPLLVTAGAGALASAGVGMWDALTGGGGEEEEASDAERAQLAGNARLVYRQLVAMGQDPDVAATIAGTMDSRFRR